MAGNFSIFIKRRTNGNFGFFGDGSIKPTIDIELLRPVDGDSFRSEKIYKGRFKVNNPAIVPDNALAKYRIADGTVYDANIPDTHVYDEGGGVYSFYFSDGYWAAQNVDVSFYVEILTAKTKDTHKTNEVTIQWSNSADKPLIPPYITKQPSSVTVEDGGSVTFSADANNFDSVKWQSSADGVAWSDIPGATDKEYSFTAAPADNGNKYKCIFSNTNGDSITNEVNLKIPGPLKIDWLLPPPAQTAGNDFTFTASASGGFDPLTWLWEVEPPATGITIDNPSQSYGCVVHTTTEATTTEIKLTVTDSKGNVATKNAPLTVLETYNFSFIPDQNHGETNEYYGYFKGKAGEITPPTDNWKPAGGVELIYGRYLSSSGLYAFVLKSDDGNRKWDNLDQINIQAEIKGGESINVNFVNFLDPSGYLLQSTRGKAKEWFEFLKRNLGNEVRVKVTNSSITKDTKK